MSRHSLSYTELKYEIIASNLNKIDTAWGFYGLKSKVLIQLLMEEMKKNPACEDVRQLFINILNNLKTPQEVSRILQDKNFDKFVFMIASVALDKLDSQGALRFIVDVTHKSFIEADDIEKKQYNNIIKQYCEKQFVFVDLTTNLISKLDIMGARVEAYQYSSEELGETILTTMMFIGLKNNKYTIAASPIHLLYKISKDKWYIALETDSNDYNKITKMGYGFGRKININDKECALIAERVIPYSKETSFIKDSARLIYKNLGQVLTDYDNALNNRITVIEKREAQSIHHKSAMVVTQEEDRITYLPMSDLQFRKRIEYTDKPKGTHQSPHPHSVNGHLRHYKNGKTIWVKGYDKPCLKYKSSNVQGQNIKIYRKDNLTEDE